MSTPGPSPPGVAPPPQVADHLVLRRIGRGSYGEVWLARNILGSYRAVKVISRRDFRSHAPFEREFNGILKYEPVSRAHPGHVDILQVGRDEAAGCFYYVMELADDAGTQRPVAPEPPGEADAPAPAWLASYVPRTLNTELQQRQRLPVADCLALGAALAEALTHLHRHGLVHRDIKPANVIFVRGQPELADIGLVTESEANAAALGTEGFIAPEGAGTPAGDVYALGKVLYELSTGLDRKRYPELPVEIGEWPDRKAFMALNAVIGRACAARTEDRCASAADLLAELQALAPGGAPTAAPQPARRHPVRQLALALGAAAGLLVAGAALWRHLQPPPAPPAPPAPATFRAQLSPEEAAAGFRLLFDGERLDAWREEITGDQAGPPHWTVQEGELRRRTDARTSWSRLIYEGTLPRDFELRFDWKVGTNAQGGVFYLPGLIKYQLADGASEIGCRTNQRPGSLFALGGPTNDLSRPAGQWNEARIVRRGAAIEHWLNGRLALQLDFSEPGLEASLREKEGRFYVNQKLPATVARRPQIRLYECGEPIAFRRLRVAALTTNAPATSTVPR